MKWVPGFIENHQLDTREFLKDPKEFTSFNDFFYRKLKPGSRPVQDGLVSPADGKVLAFEKMGHASKFFVKGNKFGIQDFLKDDSLAEKYQGGSMIIIRLAPSDYHRFHFPASGQAGETHPIKGHYYSVSPMALKKSIKIFCQNKREYCILNSSDMGDILMCEVGATMVGSILQTYSPNSTVDRGEEKGYFAFGGSTIVLLFEPGKVKIDADLLQNTEQGYETTVLMGEKIGSPVQ
jgi:phosphatidylserine decarboxylase